MRRADDTRHGPYGSTACFTPHPPPARSPPTPEGRSRQELGTMCAGRSRGGLSPLFLLWSAGVRMQEAPLRSAPRRGIKAACCGPRGASIGALQHSPGIEPGGRKPWRLGDYERDEEALVPERDPYTWWLGLCPNHHIYGSLLRARGFLITLLGSKSGSAEDARPPAPCCPAAYRLAPPGRGAWASTLGTSQDFLKAVPKALPRASAWRPALAGTPRSPGLASS